MSDPLWLPELVLLEGYEGDWDRYLEAVYSKFRQDFILSCASFKSALVMVGKQLIDGKERTFWHLISEGDVEADRTPDLRRCERIAWIRAIIEHENDSAVLSWPNTRRRNQRHVLWLSQSDFVVILEKRPNSWWLWTAYQTDREHTKMNLRSDYERWTKSQRRP